jgi:hypothetical protein
MFLGQPEGPTAGGQHGQTGARPDQPLEERRHGLHDVLAVVHHQQQATVGEVLDAGRGDVRALAELDADGGSHRIGRRRRLAHRGQLDQDSRTASTSAQQLEGEPRLPDPTGPDEGDHPGDPEQLRDLVQFPVPPQDRVRRRRYVGGHHGRRFGSHPVLDELDRSHPAVAT